MRTFGKMILACGMVALLVAPAQAQRPGGGRGFGFGGGGGGAMLLSNKSVQQELKVDDAQAEKLNALAQDVMGKQRQQFQQLQDLPQEERRAKMQELSQSINADIRKSLTDVLKPAQVKRFEQIQIQQVGILGAPDMPRIQEALKLTDDQKSQIRTIQTDQRAAMTEIFQSAGEDRAAAMTKLADLRKKGSEKAMALLTDSQKTTWKEITGEPFEVRMEPGQGGPGGAGGQRRQQNNNN